jgi:hypothetical protein
MNLDGIDDLGLFVPNRQGDPTPGISEWYILVSDQTGQGFVPHQIFNQYSPAPLGNDLFAQLGDQFALPIFGNFDPPASPAAAKVDLWNTNARNPLDVNNDGTVAPSDAVVVLSQLNAGGQPIRPTGGVSPAQYTDVNGDGLVNPSDAVMLISYLNAHGATSYSLGLQSHGQGGGGEGEGESPAADWSSTQSASDDLLDLLAADVATTTTGKRRT